MNREREQIISCVLTTTPKFCLELRQSVFDIWRFLHHLFPHSFPHSFWSSPEPAAKVLEKRKNNLFSLYFWISAQVCEGFGKDLQTFERIRVQIWGNPPPPLKKQVVLARNWAKIGYFNWGFLWDFGFEPEAALWDSNFALTDSRFTLEQIYPGQRRYLCAAQREQELAPIISSCAPNQKPTQM